MLFSHVSYAAIAAVLLSATLAFAEEDDASTIIVTATRAEEGIREDLLGSAVTVLDAKALEERQTRVVSDALRDVPGVAVGRSGGVGGTTQVRLRGGEANHTLVLIDGIEAGDPFRGEFDFATLIADDVARIEVLRGPQSALYGSDAIGGVIHYITSNGAEAPGVRGRIEGGSFGTFSAAARAAGVSGDLDYALSGAYNVTDGTPSSRFGTRNLDAENASAALKLTWSPTTIFRLRAVGRYSHIDAETNPQDFTFGSPTFGFVVDGDDAYRSRAVYALLRGELDLLDGRWSQALTGQFNDTERREHAGGLPSFSTDGARYKGSYETSFRFGGGAFAHRITGAIDIERESFRNLPVGGFVSAANDRRHIDNKGFVAEYDLRVGEAFGFGAALRHDINDRFANATTYRLQASTRFDGGLRLRAAAGSGIKNPTNFELFGFDPGSFVSNPNLKPEKSRGWEVGAEQSLAHDRVRLGLAYFDSRLKNEVYTLFLPGFVSTVANRTTDSTQQGIEATAQARLGEAWRIDAAYTWLDAEENQVREVRRPRHIASLNVAWRAPEGHGGVVLTARYNGEAVDNNYTLVVPTPLAELDDYVLVNLAADWRLTDGVRLFGRVENLFDADYEDVFTYRAPGRGAFVGLRAGF